MLLDGSPPKSLALAGAQGRGASRAPEDALRLRPRGLACLAWASLISKSSEAQRLWWGLALSPGVGAREEALPSPALPLASRHHVASLAAAFQSMCWRGALTKDCEKDSEEFLSLLGKKMGKLVKGGEAVPGPEGLLLSPPLSPQGGVRSPFRLLSCLTEDLDTAARIVLYDWQRGRIPYFTAPPEAQGPSGASGAFGQGFNAFDRQKPQLASPWRMQPKQKQPKARGKHTFSGDHHSFASVFRRGACAVVGCLGRYPLRTRF